MKAPLFRVRAGFLVPLFLLAAGCSGTELLLYLAAVLIHEGGHLSALFAFGYRARQIDLSLTGACIVPDSDLIPYRKEIWICLAGPFANLLGCGAGLWILRSAFTKEGMLFFFANALLCLFNLLPLSGLDGSRALYALLCLKSDPERARRILMLLDRVLTAFLLLASLSFWARFHNPSPLILLAAMARGDKRKSYDLS